MQLACASAVSLFAVAVTDVLTSGLGLKASRRHLDIAPASHSRLLSPPEQGVDLSTAGLTIDTICPAWGDSVTMQWLQSKKFMSRPGCG